MVATLYQLFKPSSTIPCFIKDIKLRSIALSIKNASTPNKALLILHQTHRQNIPFDCFSLVFTLKSCTKLRSCLVIDHLHSHIIKLGFNSHVYVATSMLQGYVVSSFKDACVLFDKMPERNLVTWNTMITGYSKVGDLDKATLLFKEMPSRDIASWTAMIAGYVNNGCWDCGLNLFREMVVKERIKPDQVTIGSVLCGCSHLGSRLPLVGKSVHGYMVKNGLELNVEIGTPLVDMYVKCGLFKNACQVFDLMPAKNIKTWTVLICGLAKTGYTHEALALFEVMRKSGVRPNEITFTGILSGCADAGLVCEGLKHFKMIKDEYGLEPRVQHYGCMVELFGKAGLLKKAYEIITSMRVEPNVIIWTSFLSACKDHKQFEMAERVVERALKSLRPEKDGLVYTLISELYILNGKWEDAKRVTALKLTKT